MGKGEEWELDVMELGERLLGAIGGGVVRSNWVCNRIIANVLVSGCRELDVLMIGCVLPRWCSITAKKSLKWIPFLGWFSTSLSSIFPLPTTIPNTPLHLVIRETDSPSPVTLSKTVFIDRANRTTARAAFDDSATHMRREKQSVFIFPEGTRSYATKPDLLPFKKGAFHLAIQAQVPIVPIVVANYAHILSVKARIFRPGVIDVSGERDASLLASYHYP